MSSEEKMEWVQNLEVVKNYYNKDGSLLIIAEALSTEFVPADVMKEYAHTFEGKELRWRHKLPELDVNAGVGHVHKAEVVNDKLILTAEVWNYKERPELAEIHQQIKDGELSISCGFKATRNETGEIIAIYGRELSLTPDPACTPEKGCGIIQYIQLEKGATNMPDENEKLLNYVKETVAKFEKTQGDQITTLEKLVEAKDKEMKLMKATMEQLEKRNNDNLSIISQQQEKINQNDELIKGLEKKAAGAETLSLRQEIIKLEGISEPEAVKAEMEDLASLSLEQLEKMKVRFERVNKFGNKTDPNRQTPQFGGIENPEQYENNGQGQNDPATDRVNNNEYLNELMRGAAASRQQVGPYGFNQQQGVGKKGQNVPLI